MAKRVPYGTRLMARRVPYGRTAKWHPFVYQGGFSLEQHSRCRWSKGCHMALADRQKGAIWQDSDMAPFCPSALPYGTLLFPLHIYIYIYGCSRIGCDLLPPSARAGALEPSAKTFRQKVTRQKVPAEGPMKMCLLFVVTWIIKLLQYISFYHWPSLIAKH